MQPLKLQAWSTTGASQREFRMRRLSPNFPITDVLTRPRPNVLPERLITHASADCPPREPARELRLRPWT